MRFSVLLMLSAVLLASAVGRPSEMEENNESEADEAEFESEQTGQDDEDTRLSDQDYFNEDEEGSRLVKMYQQRPLAADYEKDGGTDSEFFPEFSHKKNKGVMLEEAAKENNDFLPLSKHKQSKNIDGNVNEQQENLHLTNYKTNREQGGARNDELDKRTVDSRVSAIDGSDSIYENNKGNTIGGDRREYNSAVDACKQGRHLKLHNKIEPHNSMLGNRGYENANRDRRHAETTDVGVSTTTSTEKTLSNISIEDEEAAIKNNVKKLSGEELKELLHSLSDDKKDLLNKIMDSDISYETLEKREITKKSGAVEENGFIDSSFSEISKVQGCPSIDVNHESTKSTNTDVDNSKPQESQTEIVDTSSQKSSDTTRADDGKSGLVKQIDESKLNPDINSVSSELKSDSFSAQLTKSENRREANLDYINNSDNSFDDSQDTNFNAKDFDDSINEPEHVYSQDELAQLLDQEALLHDNVHQYKREASENENLQNESIKSLEESFPNSNFEENGKYSQSDMAPLIRVKRENGVSVVKKRESDLLESKVAYVPHIAENEDEEGSEFDDKGFLDRTSDYAKNNKIADNSVHSPQSKCNQQANVTEDSSNVKIDSESNLGSDTDSVLSEVEGVDKTLMYSSRSRNKRAAEDNDLIETENKSLRSTPLLEGGKLEENFNLPNYLENDAFDPYPRNGAELTRYKRIRRVRPTST